MTFATHATTPGSAIWLREESAETCGHVALRVDRPCDDRSPWMPGWALSRSVVAGARVVPMRHDDGADVGGPASRLVRVRPLGGADELPVVDATVVVWVSFAPCRSPARAEGVVVVVVGPALVRRAARRVGRSRRRPTRAAGRLRAASGGRAAPAAREAARPGRGSEERDGERAFACASTVPQLGVPVRPRPRARRLRRSWFAWFAVSEVEPIAPAPAAQAGAARRLRAAPRARLGRDGDGAPRPRDRQARKGRRSSPSSGRTGISRATRPSSRCSSTRRGSLRPSTTPTSSRSASSASTAACRSSSWTTSRGRRSRSCGGSSPPSDAPSTSASPFESSLDALGGLHAAHELQGRQRQAPPHHPSRRLPAQRPHRLRRARVRHRLRDRQGRGPHPDDAHARGEGQARVPRARAHRQAAHLHGAERRLLDGRRALGVLRGAAPLPRRRGRRHPAGGHERADPDARSRSARRSRRRSTTSSPAPSRATSTRATRRRSTSRRRWSARRAPSTSGTHADVARLMEAIFGARMAVRQEHVRATIGPNELTDLLRESGLPARDRVSHRRRPHGAAPRRARAARAHRPVRARDRASRRGGQAASRGAALVGDRRGRRRDRHRRAGDARRRREPRQARAHRHPRHAPAPAASDGGRRPTARKVVVPLPFLATHVELDDVARDLDPPARRGRVRRRPPRAARATGSTVIAIDGTRAEGFVREQDGIARPESDGYAFVPPEPRPPRRVPLRRGPRAPSAPSTTASPSFDDSPPGSRFWLVLVACKDTPPLPSCGDLAPR